MEKNQVKPQGSKWHERKKKSYEKFCLAVFRRKLKYIKEKEILDLMYGAGSPPPGPQGQVWPLARSSGEPPPLPEYCQTHQNVVTLVTTDPGRSPPH